MRINVAIAFDANYYNPFCSLLASIQHNNLRGSVSFHIIQAGINEHDLQRIVRYVDEFSNTIKFYAVNDSRLTEFVTMSTWTTAVYYRLYFPLLVEDHVKRLVYLDSDTLVLKALNELADTELSGYPVAAVPDIYVDKQPLIGIDKSGEYFNSGVLLIDVPTWRSQKISERAMEYLLSHPDRIRFVDQCALNAILQNNWKKLDERFNLLYSYIPQQQSIQEHLTFSKNKVVVHFTLQRPWHLLCKNRFRQTYFRYLRLSGLRRGKAIVDFSVLKISAWAAIRIKEFYNDHVLLQAVWRSVKKISWR